MKLRLLLLLFLISFFSFAQQAVGQVKGQCSTCHTMHNSQNNSKMVYMGTSGATAWAGWNGSAVLQGGTAAPSPQASLLVSDCVGCHTSTTGDTIITIGSTRVPIVFNTGGYPANPLAGGNFYRVAQSGGDAYGHNVRGISAQDGALITLGAPGTVGCSNSCHVTLTLTDAQTDGQRKNGCQGCHQSVKHHGSDPAGSPVGAAGGYYRFLSAPPGHDMVGGGGVHGIEDPNWEQNPTASNHNAYYGGTGADDEDPESIGKFCAGCHYNFHSPGFVTTMWGTDNGGGVNPWFRHPADYAIPNSGEYLNYTVYSPTVPIARPESSLTGGVGYSSTVRPGTDKVFCLSCHRAHGSQYSDMLRWSYSMMVPGTTGAGAGTGCFVCHSDKDDVP